MPTRNQMARRLDRSACCITVSVNGVLVTDVIDPNRRHAAGHLALQSPPDGALVRYRNIEVRDLGGL